MNSTPVYELAYRFYSPIFYYEFLITLHFRIEANWLVLAGLNLITSRIFALLTLLWCPDSFFPSSNESRS
jgi:hypothetical protein